MEAKIKYKFRGKVWLYPGEAAWHFITLPIKQSAKIKNLFGDVARGFGSLPVKVTIGKTQWRTSIFPDTKAGAYMLPLKVDVRRRENLSAGSTTNVTVELLPD